MVPKVLLISVVPQIPEVPRFSMVPFKVFLALVESMIPGTPMVPKVLLVPVVLWDFSPVCLDAMRSLFVLGEVNEISGFLCKIGGFCL